MPHFLVSASFLLDPWPLRGRGSQLDADTGRRAGPRPCLVLSGSWSPLTTAFRARWMQAPNAVAVRLPEYLDACYPGVRVGPPAQSQHHSPSCPAPPSMHTSSPHGVKVKIMILNQTLSPMAFINTGLLTSLVLRYVSSNLTAPETIADLCVLSFIFADFLWRTDLAAVRHVARDLCIPDKTTCVPRSRQHSCRC